jgi:hypothetical protein
MAINPIILITVSLPEAIMNYNNGTFTCRRKEILGHA